MSNWSLTTPVDAIVFDCDGTLSQIEGIDELAAQNGVGSQVKELTAAAMGETGINESLYHERLQLVRPTQIQVVAMAMQYYQHKVADVESLIHLFQQLGKAVYIVSAGLYPAVAGFGELLKVPAENIFAVEMQFDEQGDYVNFNQASPLIRDRGKRDIVAGIMQKYPKVGYVGDGMNDLAVMDLVTRFIGYGGSYYYEKVAKHCDFYINSPSMAPVLPLTLTLMEAEQLTGGALELYKNGNAAIRDGQVAIR